jgi:hypothetical protein
VLGAGGTIQTFVFYWPSSTLKEPLKADPQWPTIHEHVHINLALKWKIQLFLLKSHDKQKNRATAAG